MQSPARLPSWGLITAILLVGALLAPQARAAPDPQNTSIDQRVASLVARMTLAQKAAQLRSIYPSALKLRDNILGKPAEMDRLFEDGMGMINPDFEATVEQTLDWRNRVQEYLAHTRLGIPAIFIDEAHHGLLQQGADVFPHGIALASTWDPGLIESIYSYIANQSRARGTTLVLTPVIDVTRDPRWGRTGETYGEDPYLAGIMGSAAVRGLQGSADGTIAPGHVAATLKHFAGHGQPEGGINQAPANYSIRVLREAHMEPFRIAIQRAHPAAIMACYCEIDGIPSHANSWLLRDVLRGEWGYDGIVVSDWWGIDQLWNKHFVEPDQVHAAARAFNAGVTVDLPDGVNFVHLPDLVRQGIVSQQDLDAAVGRVLRLKFALGLFDPARPQPPAQRVDGRALARTAAQESMILLKNEQGLLPLQPTRIGKIAVVGPGAAKNYLGDYSAVPDKNVTVLDGIRARLGASRVLYAPGCRLAEESDAVRYSNYQNAGRLKLPAKEDNRKLIDTAVQVARQADLVIAVVGESEQFSQEAGSRAPGDMSDLELQANQNELVEAMVATGKPVVVYLMHARPLAINWIAANVPAIVDGAYAGEEAGNAFADILFGDVNPSGKLTISYPRSVGQLPIFYNHKPSARSFDYVTEQDEPLYPFGYGLSYTTFRYSNLRINGNTVATDLENTGPVKGTEVVQLYIHQKVSSATRPVMELKDFTRVPLAPGQKQTVRFSLDPARLAYWNAAMQYGVEPGEFEVMIGGSSRQVQKTTLRVN